jgi:hypothetical protein
VVLLVLTIALPLIIGFATYRLDHCYVRRAWTRSILIGCGQSLGIGVTRLSFQLRSFVVDRWESLACSMPLFLGVFPMLLVFLILYTVTIVVFGGMFTM